MEKHHAAGFAASVRVLSTAVHCCPAITPFTASVTLCVGLSVLCAGGSRSGAVDIIRVSGGGAVDIVKRVFWPQVGQAWGQAGRQQEMCMG